MLCKILTVAFLLNLLVKLFAGLQRREQMREEGSQVKETGSQGQVRGPKAEEKVQQVPEKKEVQESGPQTSKRGPQHQDNNPQDVQVIYAKYRRIHYRLYVISSLCKTTKLSYILILVGNFSILS